MYFVFDFYFDAGEGGLFPALGLCLPREAAHREVRCLKWRLAHVPDLWGVELRQPRCGDGASFP